MLKSKRNNKNNNIFMQLKIKYEYFEKQLVKIQNISFKKKQNISLYQKIERKFKCEFGSKFTF